MSRSWEKATPTVLAVVLVVAWMAAPAAAQTIAGCDLSQSPSSTVQTSANCTGKGNSLDLGCKALPNTGVSSQPDFDVFAWNSFAALNWPALDPETNNWQRGIPDPKNSFLKAQPGDIAVWETYLEKREVFFHNNNDDPGPWNKCIQYGSAPGMPHPAPPNPWTNCSHERMILQPLKVTFTDLDETVEVASEAQESPDTLCQGWSTAACGSAGEPACCKVGPDMSQNRPSGMAVGPRVWLGTPTSNTPPPPNGSPARPVLYEVKVNRDFFDYVSASSRKFYLDTRKAPAATAGDIQLPARTSAAAWPSPPGKTRQPQSGGVLKYTAATCANSYANASSTTNVFPCPSGSVHVKAAWIWLGDTSNPPPSSVLSKYHTTTGLYFTGSSTSPTRGEGIFGLIGLHIIQRIHAGDPMASKAEYPGGTFVFATWEHVDNDTAGFTYSNYLPYPLPTSGSSAPLPAKGFYPQPSHAIAVPRRFPMLPKTCAVNQQVHQALGSSVWSNYALIGTQFMAVDAGSGSNDPTGIGQPYYLANSVIETNDGLQHFQGQPPKVTSVSPNYPGLPTNMTYDYQHGNQNISFNGSGHNMGGCMGCHGVAQLKGTAFSFVLLLGQEGAKIDTQLDFDVPAEPPAPPGN